MDNCYEYYHTTNEPQNLNYGQMFFIMLGMLPVMFCLPVWFVAFFIHDPYVKKMNKQMEDLEDYKIPYIETYDLEKVTNEALETLDCNTNSVLETTPDGVVLMKYNKTDEGFDYWADKQISYKHLEVVARKFVTVFQCKDFYIDQKKYMNDKLSKIKKEIDENKKNIQLEKENVETGNDKIDKTDKTDKTDKPSEDDDVFAKLKSTKQKNKLKIKFTKEDFTPEIGTKFMRKGKMADSILEKKIESNKKVVKNVKFSDWKTLFGFGTSVKVEEPVKSIIDEESDEESIIDDELDEESDEESGEELDIDE